MTNFLHSYISDFFCHQGRSEAPPFSILFSLFLHFRGPSVAAVDLERCRHWIFVFNRSQNL